MKGKLEEKWLLYQVQVKQDPDAFGELYNRYIDKIYRFIFFKISSKEEAEDIASSTFLKAWHYLTSPERESRVQHFSGFIYQIARNAVIDLYRDRAKRQDVALESVAEITAIPHLPHIDIDIEERQETEQMMKLLKRLKQEYQEVILLRYVDELSIGEISEIMGKGQTAVRVTLHRALHKLRELAEQL